MKKSILDEGACNTYVVQWDPIRERKIDGDLFVKENKL